MVTYLARSIRSQWITEPLHNGKIRYYSIMNDDSSLAKTLDEKELFLIKIASEGIPKFSIMLLEEPEDANAEGLKVSMEHYLKKLELSITRAEHEIGLGSDGASVNMAQYNLLIAEFGDHYLQVWCPSHWLELAIADAFKHSHLNSVCEKLSQEVYHLFKRAMLRWRLFKRQAIIEGISIRKIQTTVWYSMGRTSTSILGVTQS